jgi:hypothetical protein
MIILILADLIEHPMRVRPVRRDRAACSGVGGGQGGANAELPRAVQASAWLGRGGSAGRGVEGRVQGAISTQSARRQR